MDISAAHAVLNQSVPPVGRNHFLDDPALQDAVAFNAKDLDTADLRALGALVGSADMQEHARLASIHDPMLHAFTPTGDALDEVEFHPSYHALMQAAMQAGLHGAAWTDAEAGAHVKRGAGFLLFSELEPGVLCPMTMTYAVTPALQGNPAILADWAPKLAAHNYDPRLIWFKDKTSVTMGMGMTERQGGSDVRANISQAEPDGEDAWGARYRLVGHKWFFSAPMCDAFLVLAQTPAGITCFFLPRILPDGSRNGLRIRRLKDKLGNRSNASSEVEFTNALAWRVGEDGRGIAQIMEMGVRTRLDCTFMTVGQMRQALVLALSHAHQRRAFGKLLIEQPLMKNVLADLALESEAATALAMRVAGAYDRQDSDEHERLISRILTPVAKFWICKRGSHFAQEAMECLGGNGYIEEGGYGVMARIYREMPLNSIWEGTGNIMTLDVLRALRQGDMLGALQAEWAPARGAHAALDHQMDRLPLRAEQALDDPAQARGLARDLALTTQAALLVQTAPNAVADAFCQSRLGQDWGGAFGTLAQGADVYDALLTRALPA